MVKKQISLKTTGSKLEVEYERKTDKVVYDLCDIHGHVLQSGFLNNEQIIDLKGIDKNQEYMLWLVDGDKLSKARFVFTE